jgi:hypothetical protein
VTVARRYPLRNGQAAGYPPVASEVRREEAMLAVPPSAGSDDGGDYPFEPELLTWSFDDDDLSGAVTVTNKVWYAPHDWPTRGYPLKAEKVCRVVVITDRAEYVVGWSESGFIFDHATELAGGVSTFRERYWLLTAAAALRAALGGSVLVAGHQACPLFTDAGTPNTSGFSNVEERWLRWLAPPVSVGEAGFLAPDLLQLVVLVRDDYRVDTTDFAYTEIGDGPIILDAFYLYTPLTYLFNYAVGAGYTADVARVAAAYPNYPRCRTVLYFDHYNGGHNDDPPTPYPTTSSTNPANANLTVKLDDTEPGLAAFAAGLADYGFEYGGPVSAHAGDAATLISLAQAHFDL